MAVPTTRRERVVAKPKAREHVELAAAQRLERLLASISLAKAALRGK